MSTTNEEVTTTTNSGAEGEITNDETVTISKKDYDTLNQTVGSLKRELKDFKKPREEAKTAQTNQPDVNPFVEKLEKLALRTAGITHPEDIELAQKTAKKWGLDIDDVLQDDDFKVKLTRQQDARSNTEATSNIKGSGSASSQKNTAEYYIAKGAPATPADIPDAKLRRKVNAAFLTAQKKESSGRFYNSD